MDYGKLQKIFNEKISDAILATLDEMDDGADSNDPVTLNALTDALIGVLEAQKMHLYVVINRSRLGGTTSDFKAFKNN